MVDRCLGDCRVCRLSVSWARGQVLRHPLTATRLSAVFGAASYDLDYGEYQSGESLPIACHGATVLTIDIDLSSMWGSAAYLISSLLQWYEAVNKNHKEELLDEQDTIVISESDRT